MSGSNVLFILSGSIACYKACEAISELVQRGHRVRTVATEAALRFVGTATLEGLTREKVGRDLFADGAALEHIDLARWADATVLCPATAHSLNRLAAGLADDLAGSLLLAHDWKKPLLAVPAMNPAMWSHPATVAAVARLCGWGVRLVRGQEGRTACGEVGEGRMAEPGDIVAAVEAALAPPLRRLRVLVTAGGTVEPIDGVRVIANTSSGRTGGRIAEHFGRSGHEVVLLRSRSTGVAAVGCREETFSTFADLDAALARLLAAEAFDAVIHAAAVSDFSVATIEVGGVTRPPGEGKLGSDEPPTLRLQRNPKLLDGLRRHSCNPDLRVVAFKLTRGATPEEARTAVVDVAAGGVADFVVHNDLATRREEAFPAGLWRADGTLLTACPDRAALAAALETLLATTADQAPTSGLSPLASGL